MYEQHFGPNAHRPPTESMGADVFIGPQSAEAMAGIKKALRSRDAVITVCGAAGSGKSTLVAKTIDSLDDTFRVVWIGRIRLSGIDALGFLLEQLAVEPVPSGAIRQFFALRAALARHEAGGGRLVVVVEDASFCGAETLAELEALTAADEHQAGGAAIVLMSDERLDDLLADIQLTRLGQRIRQRHSVRPLTEPEMRGYLRHRFRRFGGDFDAGFDKRTAEVIHALSGGIPRVANNIVEAVTATAQSTAANPVSVSAVLAIAKDELGLEGNLPDALESAAPAGAEVSAQDPPESIEDTQPQLPTLRVEEEVGVEPVPVARFDATPETIIEIALDVETVQELSRVPEPELVPADLIEPNREGLSEWDRESTVAELRPDLDALEKAIARTHPETVHSAAGQGPILDADAESATISVDEIPEITLDDAIERRTADEFGDAKDDTISSRSRNS